MFNVEGVKRNFDVFFDWAKDKDINENIPHCRDVTGEDVVRFVLPLIDSELKDPEAFYRETFNFATAVAEFYFQRWSTGKSLNDKWTAYENFVCKTTANVMKTYIPGLINVDLYKTNKGVLESIIAEYRKIKDNETEPER